MVFSNPYVVVIILLFWFYNYYAYVVSKSTRVEYKSTLGTFTAEIDNIEKQQKAIASYNDQLTHLVNQLITSIPKELSAAGKLTTGKLAFTEKKITDIRTNISINLKNQEKLLTEQRKELNALTTNIQQIRKNLH